MRTIRIRSYSLTRLRRTRSSRACMARVIRLERPLILTRMGSGSRCRWCLAALPKWRTSPPFLYAVKCASRCQVFGKRALDRMLIIFGARAFSQEIRADDLGRLVGPFEGLGDAFRRQRIEAHGSISDSEPRRSGDTIQALRPCCSDSQILGAGIV